jgi:hypothetical protein
VFGHLILNFEEELDECNQRAPNFGSVSPLALDAKIKSKMPKKSNATTQLSHPQKSQISQFALKEGIESSVEIICKVKVSVTGNNISYISTNTKRQKQTELTKKRTEYNTRQKIIILYFVHQYSI